MKLSRALKLALAACELSDEPYKLGAVIFKRKPIATGFNKTNRGWSGSHYGHWAGSLHAEIHALIKARGAAKGASIFVARKNERMAKPCGPCMAALKEAKISKVFYTNGNGVSVLSL